MPMELLDSQKLLAFVTVAREGGFSRAARKLGRTQSSVSEGVAQLEAELGQKLFERSARATALTGPGRMLLEHAETILDAMQSARLQLRQADAAEEGQLVVGTTDTLACHLLPPVFAAFRRKHPKVRLHLDNRPSPEVALEVAERRLAVGVVSLPLPPEGGRLTKDVLKVEPRTRYRDVVLLPTGHRWASRSSLSVGALVEEPLLLLDRSTATRSLLERSFETLGTRPIVAMEARSVDVLKRLVELGFGLSVVPSMAVTREVKGGSLVAVPLREAQPARSVGLVTHARAPLSPAAQTFLALARELLPTAV